MKKKVANGFDREKGRSWDGENSEKPPEGNRRPYKSMSFTNSGLASQVQEASKDSPRNTKKSPQTLRKNPPSNAPKKSQKHTVPSKREKKEPIPIPKKISVVDVSTQTTVIDAATQTDEREIQLTKMVDVRQVQSSNAYTEMDAEMMTGRLRAISLAIQTEGDQNEDLDELKFPTDTIFTDLNDLENEIAKIRYKALSLQESMKWLEREKRSNMRPTRPVGEEVDLDKDLQSREAESKFAFLPVGAEFQPKVGTHTKITGKRTLSVPVVLSTPIPFEKSPTRAIVGPDQSKSCEIHESSAFNRISTRRGLEHIRRHSKSMNDLPEFTFSYTPNRTKVGVPQKLGKGENGEL